MPNLRNFQKWHLLNGLLLLIALSSLLPIASAQSDETLVIATTAASQSDPFSPLFCSSGNCMIPLSTMFYGLVTKDEFGQPVARLAESWEANETADVWTFTIREDAIWSDGEPVTAEDVAFTYRAALHPEMGGAVTRFANVLQILGAAAYNEGTADTLEGIEVVDEKTIRFTLEAPNAIFVNEMWTGIVPAHILSEVPFDELRTHPFNVEGPSVVSGPLAFESRDAEAQYNLVRNEAFWGDPIQFERVVIRGLNDDVAATQVEAGEIEVGRIAASEAARLDALDGISVVFAPIDLFYDWAVNTRRPYLQDARVRQALTYALDRAAILDYAWEGNGVVTVPPFNPPWAVPADLNNYPYNPELARQLLEEAGWDWEQPLEIMVGSWPDNLLPAEASEAQWRELGLNVSINVIANETWFDSMQQDMWDIGMIGGFYGSDPSQFANDFLSSGFRAQVTGWSNEALDELAQQGIATTDLEARAEIYGQIAQIVNSEVPQIPLYGVGTPWAIRETVQGVRAPSNWFFLAWNITEWSR